MAKKKKKKKTTTKKVTKSYTTSKGEKVTKYSDGSETRTGGNSSFSSSSSSSSKSSSSSSSNSAQLAALQKELAQKQAELAAKLKEEASKKAVVTPQNQSQLAALQKELEARQAELAAKLKEEEEKKEEKKKEGREDDPVVEKYDSSILKSSDEYKALSEEDRLAVLAVFDAVASNDQVKAKRLLETFKASSKINDPYFAQQLRLAKDAIERGYVEIEKEAEYKELQAKARLEDLKKDYESKKQFMSLEEASVMREIERGYKNELETLQQSLVEGGFGSSSRRIQKESILNEATGDLRESKSRSFAFERNTLDETLTRGERDTQAEVARIAELTKAGKLEFLRKAEEQVGSKNLPNLIGDPAPLGGIYGSIPEEKLRDTLSSMTQFVF